MSKTNRKNCTQNKNYTGVQKYSSCQNSPIKIKRHIQKERKRWLRRQKNTKHVNEKQRFLKMLPRS